MKKELLANRRDFLKKSGVLAVGCAGFPLVVARSVLGSSLRAAPSERIVMGFIGTGKQSKHLIRAFMNERNTQVVAASDVDKQKLQRAKNTAEKFYANQMQKGTYKGCATYNDFRDLLRRQDIDAVCIATPDHWHAVTAVASARAGKDIYCEKPLSWSIDEGKAMVRAVRRARRVFQTGSMQRSAQNFRFACELVRNGYIGDIKHVVVNVGGPPKPCNLPAMPEPDYLDWNRWVGPAAFRPYNDVLSPPITVDVFPHWRDYQEFGGGGMTDWGAHHFDIAQWGLGMDGNGPTDIFPPDGKKYPVLTYRYANGITMVRDNKYPGHGSVNGILFIGTKGKVEVNRGYLKTWPSSLKTQKIGPNEIHLYESNNHYADFLKCVKSRKKPICDVAIGYSTVVVCHLGNIAYRVKHPLKWDQQKQKFAHPDPEAQSLLGRTMRAPWHV